MDYMERKNLKRTSSLNNVPVMPQGFNTPLSANSYWSPNFPPIEDEMVYKLYRFGKGINSQKALKILSEADRYRPKPKKRSPIDDLSPRLRESLEMTRSIYSANSQVTPQVKHHNNPFLTQIPYDSWAMSLSQSSSSPGELSSAAFNLTPQMDTHVVPKLRIKPDNSRVMAQCYNYNFTPKEFKPLPQLRRVQSRQEPNFEHLCRPLAKDIPTIKANRNLRAMSELGKPHVFSNQEYEFENELLDADFYSNRHLKPYPAKRRLKSQIK